MRNLTKFMTPVREPENTLREPFFSKPAGT